MGKLITIDCRYLENEFAASYLMIEASQALFVDNNTAHSVPLLLEELRKQGLTPEQVRYLVITHVHLDHAGGSSVLMQACPNATLLAHPRAVPHLVDPSKLVSSARAVYGDQKFEELYGRIDPIPAERVRAVEDGEKISFGSRTLSFFHTRGHANHHFCIHDSGENGVFTGDSFGLAYPVLQKKGLFVFPSTSPTDFDPPEAKKSVQRIVDTGADRAYLTHFGEVSDLPEAKRQLLAHLEFSESLLNTLIHSQEPDSMLQQTAESQLRLQMERALMERGITPDPEIWKLLKLDLELNAAGIAHVARKRRAAAKTPLV